MADKLNKLGGVQIESLAIISANGKNVSIKPQLVTMNIYEDIFKKFITGEVIVKDVLDIRGILPLVGNETLNVKLKTPSIETNFSGDYYIYKISESYEEDRQLVYAIYFISPEAISSKNIKISKTFRGSPVDMLVEILGESYLRSIKPFFGNEKVKNKFVYISNFWSGAKNIDYICDHSLNENGSPTYLFYETHFGFHFNSLDNLISDNNKVVHSFIISEYEKQMNGKDNVVESTVLDYKQVHDVKYETGFDYIKRVESGFYGGRSITFDPITSRYVEKQIVVDGKNKLNKYDCVSKNFYPASNNALTILTPKYFNNIEDSGDNTNSDYKILRSGFFSRLRNQRVTIKVFGRFDYFVGEKVELKVSKTGQTGKDVWDEYLSGNYLITSLKHSIGKENHYTFLELSKGSYAKSLE